MAEYMRRGPTHVRVTGTRDELHACVGTGPGRSWEVPRRQWEQYVAHKRETDRRGEDILALQPREGE